MAEIDLTLPTIGTVCRSCLVVNTHDMAVGYGVNMSGNRVALCHAHLTAWRDAPDPMPYPSGHESEAFDAYRSAVKATIDANIAYMASDIGNYLSLLDEWTVAHRAEKDALAALRLTIAREIDHERENHSAG